MNRQRDAAGLMAFDERIVFRLPAERAARPPAQPAPRARATRAGRRSDVARPLQQLAEALVRRSLVVLISDLLDDPEPIIKGLKHLKSRGNDVIVFQVLDPERADVPVPRLVALQGSRERRRSDRRPGERFAPRTCAALDGAARCATTASCAAPASTTCSSTRRSRSTSRCSATCRRARAAQVKRELMSFLYPAFLLGALAIAIPDRAAPAAARCGARSAVHRRPAPAPVADRARATPASAGSAPARGARRGAAAAGRGLRPSVRAGRRAGAGRASSPSIGRTAWARRGVFAAALDLARQAIDDGGPGERVAVIAFDDRADVVAAPGGGRRCSRGARGACGRASARRATGRSFSRRSELAAGAAGRLVIVTDLQRAGWDGESATSLSAGLDARGRVMDAGRRRAARTSP